MGQGQRNTKEGKWKQLSERERYTEAFWVINSPISKISGILLAPIVKVWALFLSIAYVYGREA